MSPGEVGTALWETLQTRAGCSEGVGQPPKLKLPFLPWSNLHCKFLQQEPEVGFSKYKTRDQGNQWETNKGQPEAGSGVQDTEKGVVLGNTQEVESARLENEELKLSGAPNGPTGMANIWERYNPACAKTMR